jgi:hypothetical protein
MDRWQKLGWRRGSRRRGLGWRAQEREKGRNGKDMGGCMHCTVCVKRAVQLSARAWTLTCNLDRTCMEVETTISRQCVMRRNSVFQLATIHPPLEHGERTPCPETARRSRKSPGTPCAQCLKILVKHWSNIQVHPAPQGRKASAEEMSNRVGTLTLPGLGTGTRGLKRRWGTPSHFARGKGKRERRGVGSGREGD